MTRHEKINQLIEELEIEDAMKMITKKEFMMIGADVIDEFLQEAKTPIEMVVIGETVARFGARLTARIFDEE